MKLVPYNKMSKKAKKAYDAKKRGSWGNVKPVKRIETPKTVYNRKRIKIAW